MMTINGIGTRFYGYSDKQADGSRFATIWFTFLYLPVVPLKRVKVFFKDEDQYLIIEKSALQLNEVLSTYFWGLVAFPLILFTPIFLSIEEVATSLGLPSYEAGGSPLDGNVIITEVIMWLAILWRIVVMIWWVNWDAKRRVR